MGSFIGPPLSHPTGVGSTCRRLFIPLVSLSSTPNGTQTTPQIEAPTQLLTPPLLKLVPLPCALASNLAKAPFRP
jgi:hypothetical protein